MFFHFEAAKWWSQDWNSFDIVSNAVFLKELFLEMFSLENELQLLEVSVGMNDGLR